MNTMPPWPAPSRPARPGNASVMDASGLAGSARCSGRTPQRGVPTSHDRRMTRPGAFTLIEILVVVGIIGLTLTMGVPAFVRALHKEGMRKAQSDLLEACQKARAGAIINARPQELIIRPMDRSFEAPGAFPLTILPDGVSIGAISLNDMVMEHDDVVVVRFFPKGSCDDFIMVIHSDKDGSQCTISLDPVSALADLTTSR